ncbi:MAG TPA: lipopolysaccharide kinase InaA family protein [Planctomycetota bacterium]
MRTPRAFDGSGADLASARETGPGPAGGELEGSEMMPRRASRHYRPLGRPTVVVDQGQVIAAEADLPLLRELGLDTLAGALRFAAGTVVRDAGPRRTFRVRTSGGTLYVKVHRGLPRGGRWRLFGNNGSPARREWDNIGALRRAGFDMPEPVAVGERANAFGVPAESYLITREVCGQPLDELLREGWPDPHGRGPLAARQAVLQDVAGMIRRLHANGFFHKDCYCGHLIVAPDPRWGRPYLIDLARVEQRFPPRRRWLVKDLAALESSCGPNVSRSDKLRFLLIYLCKNRVDPLARRWAREILAKSAHIRSHVPRYG